MSPVRSHPDEFATFVVELSPTGRGAVAVVLVDGPAALRVVGQRFSPNAGRPLGDVPLNRITVGRWDGDAGEELVVARRGDEQIEVHCHGGVAAVERIVADLVAEGCQARSWREWLCLRRTLPRLDRTSVATDAIGLAARVALADAVTARTAAILLDQLNGALSAAIGAVIDAVEQADWPRAADVLDQLLARRQLGSHLIKPWRVVLAGLPNVGKSSLINALAGFERAIVSPLPGTTRDVVTLTTAIEGWPVELADTAGLRTTGDTLEAAGVQLAQATLATADLVLLVHDATRPHEWKRIEFHAPRRIPRSEPPPSIDVYNKIDLLPNVAGHQHASTRPQVSTSAVTGQGIAELLAMIGALLVPDLPSPGAAIPFTHHQIETLATALRAVEQRNGSAARAALQSLPAD